MIMIFLDPDNKILSLCSKQSLTGSRTTGGALHLSVWSCWGRLVYIHQQSSSSSSYTSLCQHTAVQQSETQDWPESSTEGIIWLIQLLNTAMLAPSHRQISTTFYLHAQFVASFATCDSVPTLTSRRVWHFIIAKLSNEKFSFRLLFFIFIFFFSKRSRGSNMVLHVDTTEEYIVTDKVKSRPKSPSASDTVEVCSSLHRHTSGDSSSSQYRKHNNVA